ncbi:MAG: OmpG family monomeric porin [Rahnella inusitata]|jgi:outer membrane protein G|uniref:OmpG family monomeric porin n=1 Tax=Rahnella inusitata TaxID=58169 RepID=UPI002F395665
MKAKTLAALLCGAVSLSAFSAEKESVNKNEDHNSPEMLTPVPIGEVNPPAEKWSIQIGAMQETENVEGQGDKDGAYEPTVFINFSKGKWNLYGAFYQEDHNVDYTQDTRSDWFNQYEFDAHYQFVDNADYALGLMLGFRNYQWEYNEDKHKEGNTYNTQRYTLQPDWSVSLSPVLKYNGWAALYNYYNNMDENGYLNKEFEGETGVKYSFSDAIAVQVSYYLDRGWNTGDSQRGEFSKQEARVYLPLNVDIFSSGKTLITPYARRTLDTYYYNDDRGEREGETDTRFGVLINQSLPAGFAISLEYAYELQLHDNTDASANAKTKYHYTGIGVTYSF